MISAADGAAIRRLARQDFGHREISRRTGVSRFRVLTFMRDHDLVSQKNRKNVAHRRQEFQLPVNLRHVRLPDVDEEDVKLARQFWREVEGVA